MRKLTGEEIRELWFNFWASKGHEIVPSASLIPDNDPTLLWINSGVATFKKYFDGRLIPNNRRLASCQKAIRTNDIENVGKTARHHTFFEMLGNFSVGDYFRKEVLPWAMEFLTEPKWLGLPLEKLYFSVHPDDEETINLWQNLGVSLDHIISLEGNFWEIGTGPCGPNTEIFFDRGEKYDLDKKGVSLLKNDLENDRYIEIWNIVFSQYNADPNKQRKNYDPLPSKNIDTGAGLERIACILQETETNYETDLFMPMISELEKITKVEYKGQMAFRVIADHIRALVFALADGATFSNEGRGYVLRRLLRRAMRFGKTLGISSVFLKDLVEVVVMIMKKSYPYLLEKISLISEQIKTEEEKFLLTLESGEKRLLDLLNNKRVREIKGDVAFLLYDTFGFPLELTIEVSKEYKKPVDVSGFEKLLTLQKQKSKSARLDEQSMNIQNKDVLAFNKPSKFVGYETLEANAKVIGIFKDGKSLKKGKDSLVLLFDINPFYVQSGGQNTDHGTLSFNGKDYLITEGFKFPNLQNALIVNNISEIKLDDEVKLCVDKNRREAIMKNHSATHLLNEALRHILGSHVHQQGSLVEEKYLRFDFNNFKSLTSEELLAVEDLVNLEISEHSQTKVIETSYDEAVKMGAQAMFDEKYGDSVRMVTIGFSKELCGGTHVQNTLDIDSFAISKCETKGSGIYRIEASTSDGIFENLEDNAKVLKQEISSLREKHLATLEALKGFKNIKAVEIPSTKFVKSYRYLINLKAEKEELLKEIKKEEKLLLNYKAHEEMIDEKKYLLTKEQIKLGALVVITDDFASQDQVKNLVDRVSDQIKPGVTVYAGNINGRLQFFVKSTTKDSASVIVKEMAKICLGSGGGRDDFAQGGGKESEKLPEAILKVKALLGAKS